MIPVPLARALRDAGLDWQPAPGDRFVVADRDMDDQVFVLSDMTVEVHQHGTASVIRFNGTTEWALDSIELDEALWLPSEEQLRLLLGASFTGLAVRDGRFVVTATTAAGTTAETDGASAAEAYGHAVLAVLAARRT